MALHMSPRWSGLLPLEPQNTSPGAAVAKQGRERGNRCARVPPALVCCLRKEPLPLHPVSQVPSTSDVPILSPHPLSGFPHPSAACPSRPSCSFRQQKPLSPCSAPIPGNQVGRCAGAQGAESGEGCCGEQSRTLRTELRDQVAKLRAKVGWKD